MLDLVCNWSLKPGGRHIFAGGVNHRDASCTVLKPGGRHIDRRESALQCVALRAWGLPSIEDRWLTHTGRDLSPSGLEEETELVPPMETELVPPINLR